MRNAHIDDFTPEQRSAIRERINRIKLNRIVNTIENGVNDNTFLPEQRGDLLSFLIDIGAISYNGNRYVVNF